MTDVNAPPSSGGIAKPSASHRAPGRAPSQDLWPDIDQGTDPTAGFAAFLAEGVVPPHTAPVSALLSEEQFLSADQIRSTRLVVTARVAELAQYWVSCGLHPAEATRRAVPMVYAHLAAADPVLAARYALASLLCEECCGYGEIGVLGGPVRSCSACAGTGASEDRRA